MGVWLSRPQPLSHSHHTCVNQGDKVFSQLPIGKFLPSSKVWGWIKLHSPALCCHCTRSWTGMFTGKLAISCFVLFLNSLGLTDFFPHNFFIK